MERRNFLTSAALTAASYEQVMGANDRVRLGIIGCGGRGRYVGKFMSEAPGAQFVAAADVYLRNAEQARALGNGGEVTVFQDFRKLLERKDVDAVLIATPDHWHALTTMFACQAGKDVYVEKPLAHNIHEGRVMVEAAVWRLKIRAVMALKTVLTLTGTRWSSRARNARQNISSSASHSHQPSM